MGTNVDSWVEQRSAGPAATGLTAGPARLWLLVAAGLIAFPLALALGGDAGLWLPALGVGVALVSWTAWWLLPLLAIEALAVSLLFATDRTRSVLGALLLVAQIGVSWWAYRALARGARWLEDPRSCVLFLVLVPGLIAAGFALVQALLWTALAAQPSALWILFGTLWMSRILGLLVPMPLLLVLLTPWLSRQGLIAPDPPLGVRGNPWHRLSPGEVVEVAGLTLSAVVLALVLLGLEGQRNQNALPPWSLWGVGLIIVVWSALRQGLRGGAVVAGVSSLGVLLVTQGPGLAPADGGPLQGFLLAQCSTALLVGVSMGWIQASEARYRHVVSELPLVLYSARLPQPLRSPLAGGPAGHRRDSKLESPGPTISRQAVVTLVSRASQQVFDCDPEAMTGPYAQWLARIIPADRELLIAALGQLNLQRQPVTCEYRIVAPNEPAAPEPDATPGGVRWVRDTLTPHHTEDGLLDGWEGFVEDITERRKLSYNLRRSSQMLQALIANLPAGVFFVHGAQGYPLLANARARQLLGQREDASVPLGQLSRLYRLHRPDGSEYPPDELPVAKALTLGLTCSANDIVVHRPDGRRITLVTWAAPVQIDSRGPADGAVWVLEDLSALQDRHGLPAPCDVASLLRLIQTQAAMAQNGLPADHPAHDALRRVLELSTRAVHLAGQAPTTNPPVGNHPESR
jgi:PAS domain-containing protein